MWVCPYGGNGSFNEQDTRRGRESTSRPRQRPTRRFRVHVGSPLFALVHAQRAFWHLPAAFRRCPWVVCPRKSAAKSLSHQEQRHVAALARNAFSTSPLPLAMAMTLPVSLATRTGTPRNQRRPRPAREGCLPAMGRPRRPAAGSIIITCITLGPGPRLPYCIASSSCGSPLAHHHHQHSKSMAEISGARGNVLILLPPSLPPDTHTGSAGLGLDEAFVVAPSAGDPRTTTHAFLV